MRASRGMGAINPSKMPGKKKITRKDDPNEVDSYAKGGVAKIPTPKASASVRKNLGVTKGRLGTHIRVPEASAAPADFSRKVAVKQMLNGLKK